MDHLLLSLLLLLLLLSLLPRAAAHRGKGSEASSMCDTWGKVWSIEDDVRTQLKKRFTQRKSVLT